jgi:cell shape-determining protein MreD
MVNRSTLLLFVLIVSALVQARLFPEIGLDRWISLPLLLTLLYSTPRRRPVLLAAGLIGGLLIDTLLWRPLGLTSAALVTATLVAASVRGSAAPGWVRRSAAGLAGFAAAELLLALAGGLLGESGGARGGEEPLRLLLNVALLTLGAFVGARRRDAQLRERPLDDRLG